MAGKFLDNDGLARFKENMLQEVEARMGMPLGFEYFQTNPNVRAGSLPLTGGLYSRTIYADLWAWIQSQDGYLISEAEWQAKAEANGGAVPFYSDGDGSTTFRVPALTVWVKGANGNEAVGDYLADTFASHKHNVSVESTASVSSNGSHSHKFIRQKLISAETDYSDTGSSYAATSVTTTAMKVRVDTESVSDHSHTVTITNAVSESSQGGEETRPKTIIGIYCVIAFGTVTSSGVVDLQSVQTVLKEAQVVMETADLSSVARFKNYGDARDRDSTKPTYGL